MQQVWLFVPPPSLLTRTNTRRPVNLVKSVTTNVSAAPLLIYPSPSEKTPAFIRHRRRDPAYSGQLP